MAYREAAGESVKPLQHLLGIREMERDQIEHLLHLAQPLVELSRRPIKKVPVLRGKTVINLFFETSTRTRTSFELAGKRLSADVINISATTSATKKGESLLDTGHTLAAMQPDVLIIRDSRAGAAHFLSGFLKNTAVVNAGDGAHEHPTQVLTDLLTLQQAWGDVAGKIITIVGDIAHSRVARSHLLAAGKMGYKVRLVAPKTLLPVQIERFGCELFTDFDAAIVGSDAVYMLRVQNERLEPSCSFPSVREYHEAFGLNMRRLKLAGEHMVVLHPGPMNRGVEIATDVADCARSRILNQVENGVAVRMAVLTALCGSGQTASKKRGGNHREQAMDTQGTLL